jgi:hypothetical protein
MTQQRSNWYSIDENLEENIIIWYGKEAKVCVNFSVKFVNEK